MRFFTSDPHFGHAAIIGFCERPFDTVEEMNEALIDRWNATVSADDWVYMVGDVALGRHRLDTLQEVLPRLNGHKFLIPGNHDFCWPGRHAGPTLAKWEIVYTLLGFDILDTQIELRLKDGTWVDICHFPYQGDHTTEERYQEWRPEDRGRWLIHGHIHEKWLQWGRMINIGVDRWDFTPVAEDWIIDMIANGEQDIPPERNLGSSRLGVPESDIIIEMINKYREQGTA